MSKIFNELCKVQIYIKFFLKKQFLNLYTFFNDLRAKTVFSHSLKTNKLKHLSNKKISKFKFTFWCKARSVIKPKNLKTCNKFNLFPRLKRSGTRTWSCRAFPSETGPTTRCRSPTWPSTSRRASLKTSSCREWNFKNRKIILMCFFFKVLLQKFFFNFPGRKISKNHEACTTILLLIPYYL